MENIKIEIYLDKEWRACGELQLTGSRNEASIFTYDVDYFFQYTGRIDAQISVNCPLQLDGYHYNTYPPFIMDILPVGLSRRQLEKKYKIQQESDFLKFGANNPVGLIRTEVFEEPEPTLFDINDARLDNEEFKELAAIKGGTDLQGDAPKMMAVKDTAGNWFIDNGAISGDHYILKFPRKRKTLDYKILENEYKYMLLASEIGVNVYEAQSFFYNNTGVLGIPRFDIKSDERYGMESLYSILNKLGGGQPLNQYECCEKVLTYCGHESLIEYLNRDLLNFALGNTDNHGRNSSLLKKGEKLSLSPLYDFAPMIADTDTIIRTSKWMKEESSVEIKWDDIYSILENELDVDLREAKEFKVIVQNQVKSLLKKYSVDTEILEFLEAKLKTLECK